MLAPLLALLATLLGLAGGARLGPRGFRSALECRRCGRDMVAAKTPPLDVTALKGSLLGIEARTAAAPRQQLLRNPGGTDFKLSAWRGSVEGSTIAAGEVDTSASWFEGFGWQVLLCGGCRSHVGWLFSAPPPADAAEGRPRFMPVEPFVGISWDAVVFHERLISMLAMPRR